MKKKLIYKNLHNKFLKKKYTISVWGVGYIGLSSMVFFAKKGVKCIGYDVDNEKVKKINRAILPISDLKSWFKFDIKPLVKKKIIQCTNDYNNLIKKENIVHLIAIPTEKNGKPYFSILFQTLKKISLCKKKNIKPIIIIESTLTPNFTKKFIVTYMSNLGLEEEIDYLLGVAPRRDWFVANTKNLSDLDRVIGSNNLKNGKLIKDFLSIVCKKIHVASSYSISEMVKSIENAYRHMEITLANQLSLAYKKFNMREVLELVGTKWNIGTFYPGFGTGGYCIPLSSQYVLREVKNKKNLTLLRETIKTDNKINEIIAQSIIKKKFKKIAILGLSYKGNLKVHTLSPVLPFINKIKKSKKIQAKIFDPFYEKKELKKITGLDVLKYPLELKKFDAIILTVDHDFFKKNKKVIEKNIKNVKYILDNQGIWSKLNFNKKTIYKISGYENWV